MITKSEQLSAQRRAAELIRAAGIPVSADEEARIEVADFGLSNLQVEGAQILTWLQTERIGVKVIALFPGQTLPEHWHPQVGNDPGKEETVRHVAGDLLIYVEGDDSVSRGSLPAGKDACYRCRHEVVPSPGDQFTFAPRSPHWFQAGERGAVAFSFSSVVRDALDGFTDPEVRRGVVVVDDPVAPAAAESNKPEGRSNE